MKKTLCYRIFLYFSKPYETAYNLSPLEAQRNETAYISQRKSSVQQPNVVKPLTLGADGGCGMENAFMKPLTLTTEGKKKPLTEPPVRGNTMNVGQYYNLFNNQ
jgi:hypothetical protein